MNKTYPLFRNLILAACLLSSCNSTEKHPEEHHSDAEHAESVHLSGEQVTSLGLKTDSIPMRNMNSRVEVNGELEVPPQNEATVTAYIGANIRSIRVIEGDAVRKGQVLAYLSHPELIRLQTDYVNSLSRLDYLESEYTRQENLYQEKVGSGRDYQKTKADYLGMRGTVKGYEAELRLLGLNLKQIASGKIYEEVPVFSPIDGYVRLVEVKTGQYVQPQTELFELVNIEHIHADLMVFEKDVHKVAKGQKVRFEVESLPGRELQAVIYAVGKSFEQDPKAIHLHAEIENKEGLLIPGMYVRGQILTEGQESYALPEAAVVREGDRYYIFSELREGNETVYKPVEVIPGVRDAGWVELQFPEGRPAGRVVWNQAYYLMAELKKGDAGHSH